MSQGYVAYWQDHPEVRSTVNNFGAALFTRRDLEGAEHHLQGALAMRIRLIVEDHWRMAVA